MLIHGHLVKVKSLVVKMDVRHISIQNLLHSSPIVPFGIKKVHHGHNLSLHFTSLDILRSQQISILDSHALLEQVLASLNHGGDARKRWIIHLFFISKLYIRNPEIDQKRVRYLLVQNLRDFPHFVKSSMI